MVAEPLELVAAYIVTMSYLTVFKKAIPLGIFSFLQPVYHFFLAGVAALVYWFPSRRLIVIGVTGTKGKTTVVELLHAMLQENDVKVASASSLRFKIGEEETKNELKMTMPGRFFLQKFLYDATQKGCKYAVLEVTSEGIKQFRHRFVRFEAAVMTNVEPEHVEAHGSFEKYLRAKLDLFWRLDRDAVAVINRDDPLADRFVAACRGRYAWYARRGVAANGREWPVDRIRIGREGISLRLGGRPLTSSLTSEPNFYNILAAATGALALHLPFEKIAAGIKRVDRIPGRLEYIQKGPFAVVVDYAHTPGSLKHVYAFLRADPKLKNHSQKLICVFGSAGGGRDKWKRPELGKIAATYCDEIILTNEDPYDENPTAILEEIAVGFSQVPSSKFPVQGEARPHERQVSSSRKILDRREAIREALMLAHAGDTVVITGKGSEPWIMGAGGVKTLWDDRGVVRELLAQRAIS